MPLIQKALGTLEQDFVEKGIKFMIFDAMKFTTPHDLYQSSICVVNFIAPKF